LVERQPKVRDRGIVGKGQPIAGCAHQNGSPLSADRVIALTLDEAESDELHRAVMGGHDP
jgi:hypothetical protein